MPTKTLSRILVACLLLSVSMGLYAQAMHVNPAGNVGIGTLSPNEALTIERIDAGARMQLTGISSVSNEAPQMIWKRARSNVGAPDALLLNDNLGAFSFRGYTGSAYSGSRGFINVQATEDWTPTANGTRMLFQTTENGTAAVRTVMEITHDGRVKINGTTLVVPDYVFEEDYELMSLDQLSAYIDVNKHLPGVASAKEVNTEGLDLASSQLSVLEKVEELTLYTLQQHEVLKQMELENQQLQVAHKQLLTAYHDLMAEQNETRQLVNELLQKNKGSIELTSLK